MGNHKPPSHVCHSHLEDREEMDQTEKVYSKLVVTSGQSKTKKIFEKFILLKERRRLHNPRNKTKYILRSRHTRKSWIEFTEE